MCDNQISINLLIQILFVLSCILDISLELSGIYDSKMVMDSMKDKMRSLLLKHPNGILSYMFMGIYEVCLKISKTLLNTLYFLHIKNNNFNVLN